MTECYSKVPDSIGKLLNPQPLYEYLNKFKGGLYYNVEENDSTSDEICFKVLNNVTFSIRKLKDEAVNKTILNMKVLVNDVNLAKSILNIVKNNIDLFVISEIISHGATYFDSTANIKRIIEHLETNTEDFTRNESNSNKIIQVVLENFKLDVLISILLTNSDKILILSPTETGRSVLSCFLLMSLLHQSNPNLVNQFIFLLIDKDYPNIESIISSRDWILKNRSIFSLNKSAIYNYIEKESCFLLMNDCDVFCGAVNFLNSFGTWSIGANKPKLCLIPESVYQRFIMILKSQIEKSKSTQLFDMNRQISLNYIDDIDFFLGLFKEIDKDDPILIPKDPCLDSDSFFQPFIMHQIQPQHEVFNNKSMAGRGSFLLTFRTCEEGIMLANKLLRNKHRLYLWTETISLCLELKSRLHYEEIFVNMIDWKQEFVAMTPEIICRNSLVASEQSPKSNLSNQLKLAPNFFQSNAENRNFIHRFRVVKRIIRKSISDGLLSEQIADFWKRMVEKLDLKGSRSGYERREMNLHVLIEHEPIGFVVLYLGSKDVSENAFSLVLLSWLLGNDVIIISASLSFHTLLKQVLIDSGQLKSIMTYFGTASLFDLNQFSFINSVIAVDNLMSDDHKSPLDVKFLFFYDLLDSKSNSYRQFGEVLPFLQTKKVTCLTAGGVNTK